MRFMMLGFALCSCASTTVERAKNAGEIAGYTLALDGCRQKGKAANSFAIYEECAAQADSYFGRTAGVK